MAIRPLFMRGVSLTASVALSLTGVAAVAVVTAAPAEAGAVTAHFCPKAPGVTVVGTDATTGYPICQQLFNESGTFTVPFDVSAVDVVLAGGGGGGGGGGTDAFGAVLAGGGGAGGSVALYKDLAVTPGTPVAVTVGAGGANGVGGSATDITTWTGTNGSAGGDSAFGAWSTPGGGGGTAAGSDGSVITVGTGGSTAAGSNIIGTLAGQAPAFPSSLEDDHALDWSQNATETLGAYREVNAAFFHTLQPFLEKGDVVWVHDYHLMLLPSKLREQRDVDISIVFFLHIPFPTSQVT